MSDQGEDEDPPVVLDKHRGMAAQKATNERRRLSVIADGQETLRKERAELERTLFSSAALDWPEAALKATYLLNRFAQTAEARDPRLLRLIASVLADFEKLRTLSIKSD